MAKGSDALDLGLFKDKLIKANGGGPASIAGDRELIGLYFSAHWCPPCRGFTPELAKYYQENPEGLQLEIVFISSDRDEASFKEYCGEMPWLALDYKARDIKDELSKKYGVRGIPTLIILDKNGTLKIENARGLVMNKNVKSEI